MLTTIYCGGILFFDKLLVSSPRSWGCFYLIRGILHHRWELGQYLISIRWQTKSLYREISDMAENYTHVQAFYPAIDTSSHHTQAIHRHTQAIHRVRLKSCGR